MEEKMTELTKRLRFMAQHDGNSTDSHVNFCLAVHEACELLEAQEEIIEQLKDALEAIYDLTTDEGSRDISGYTLEANFPKKGNAA